MTPEALNRLVSEGISAVRRGDNERGRALLLHVVEQDERIEEAWMWLSVAMEDPEDKLIALENVLAINPANAAAEANARWWRQKIAAETPGAAPPAFDGDQPDSGADLQGETPEAAGPGTPAPGQVSPVGQDHEPGYAQISPLDRDESLYDPYQCVYCGAAAAREDRRCPSCGKSLIARRKGQSGPSPALSLAVLLITLDGSLGLLQSLGPGFALAIAAGQDIQPFRVMSLIIVVPLLLGDFLSYTPAEARLLLIVGLARGGILLLLAGGLWMRQRPVYFLSIAVLIADLLGTGYRFITNHGGSASLVLDAGLALGAAFLLFSCDREFGAVTERMLTRFDPTGKGGLDFHRRGHVYRRQGKWALAVAQWRRAVALMPAESRFYKDLAVGYSQINRFERALAALQQAAALAPADTEIDEMMTLVKARQASARKASGQ